MLRAIKLGEELPQQVHLEWPLNKWNLGVDDQRLRLRLFYLDRRACQDALSFLLDCLLFTLLLELSKDVLRDSSLRRLLLLLFIIYHFDFRTLVLVQYLEDILVLEVLDVIWGDCLWYRDLFWPPELETSQRDVGRLLGRSACVLLGFLRADGHVV